MSLGDTPGYGFALTRLRCKSLKAVKASIFSGQKLMSRAGHALCAYIRNASAHQLQKVCFAKQRQRPESCDTGPVRWNGGLFLASSGHKLVDILLTKQKQAKPPRQDHQPVKFDSQGRMFFLSFPSQMTTDE